MESNQARQYGLQSLAHFLHGELVLPGDQDFDDARSVWNAAIDRRPVAIVRCADAADVIAAVTVARQQGLPLSVRSGGHEFAGRGTNDGGMVIDLSGMKGIAIDPVRRTARIEPGLTWGEVAQEAHQHGLALTSGDMGSVGVGGLTLGGGIGWMVRKHGLTIDNLLSVDVVTADGRLLRASAEENADLFWGLRGGGGNFGIATAFEFQLHAGGLIVGGAAFYDATDAANAAAILRDYARYTATAPDELTTMALLMKAPPAPFIPAALHGTPVVAILACYSGAIEEGLRVVAPLRTLGTPIADVLGPMPYPAMFAITAEGAVRGRQHDVRSLFLHEIDDEIVAEMVALAATVTTPAGMVQLRILGGAMGRVPEGATAFAHRDARAMLTVANSWDDPADAAQQYAWLEQWWPKLQPYAAGVYVNFLADEGDERIKAAYKPETFRRLVDLKDRYDPTNVFRLNQNIAPTQERETASAGDGEGERAA